MTIPRLLEIALAFTVPLLPHLILAGIAFRRQHRFKWPLTAVLLFVWILVQISLGIWILQAKYQWMVSMLTLPVNAGFYALLVKSHWGKRLFTQLTLTNLSRFITTTSKMLEGLVFPSLALQTYRWSHGLLMFLLAVVIIIPMSYYFRRIFSKAMQNDMPTVAWRYLWFIPLTFYSVWFRNAYFSAEGAFELSLRPRYALFSLVINSGALLVYAMICRFINEQAENEALREKERQHAIQQAQYANIHERIEEGRRTKHDLRQHLHVVSAYLREHRYEELESYVNRYSKNIPEDTLMYCDNFAVNALLQYFAGYAKLLGVGFSATVSVPANTGIPEEDLTVALGNILENAIEACSAQESGAVISVRGKTDRGSVFFKVVNSCPQMPKTDRNGQFLSSKRSGLGIGLRSVENITQRYNGMMQARWEDGNFTVSLLLNAPSS